MVKTIFFLSLGFFVLSACSNNSGSATTAVNDSGNKTATVSTPANPEVSKGLELVAKSDCFTCHKINDALVGPAYSAVAAKYPATPANIDSLANKVIKGGSGNWGSVAMTPHQQVSQEDARLMVKYILSLKQ